MKTAHTSTNILVTGSMSLDTIMNFPSQFVKHLDPKRLHQINVSFVVNKLEKQIGGTATNIAYGAAQCLKQIGTSSAKPRVFLAGGLGKDGGGHLKFFKKHSIETQNIIVDKRMYSAAGTVITDMSDNQIWGFYYGASVKAKEVSFASFSKKPSIAIISANHPESFLHFQKECIDYSIPYMYDPGMALSWITDSDLLRGTLQAKYLIGNDYEIAAIGKRTKLSIKELTRRGVNVIVTLGDKGVEYYSSGSDEGKIFVKAVKVTTVDPTGAGDAWRGGFLASFSQGLSLSECLINGNVIASFAVEHYGCVSYTITRKAFATRIKILKSSLSTK